MKQIVSFSLFVFVKRLKKSNLISTTYLVIRQTSSVYNYGEGFDATLDFIFPHIGEDNSFA